jgi:hypothetical protein
MLRGRPVRGGDLPWPNQLAGPQDGQQTQTGPESDQQDGKHRIAEQPSPPKGRALDRRSKRRRSRVRKSKSTPSRMPANSSRIPKGSIAIRIADSVQPKIDAHAASQYESNGGFERTLKAGSDLPSQLISNPYGSRGSAAICRASASMLGSSIRNAEPEKASTIPHQSTRTRAPGQPMPPCNARTFVAKGSRPSSPP